MLFATIPAMISMYKSRALNIFGKIVLAKNKLDRQIKKYGTKAHDLLESVEFILNREF